MTEHPAGSRPSSIPPRPLPVTTGPVADPTVTALRHQAADLVRALRERAASDDPAEVRAAFERLASFTLSLAEAVHSRDVIGQAKGVLMQTRHLTEDEAFDHLRRASQLANRKLRDVAEQVALTGAVPEDDARD